MCETLVDFVGFAEYARRRTYEQEWEIMVYGHIQPKTYEAHRLKPATGAPAFELDEYGI